MKDSEQKRLQSLIERKKTYKQQKNVIQQALANIETKTSNNKIIFDENDTAEDFKKNTFFLKPIKKQKKIELFEDNDEDINQIDFNKQLSEDKGQKLLELQSRFAHDPRFKLDSRFIENENEGEQQDQEHRQNSENDLESEKKKQLDILASITGKRITSHDSNKKQKPLSKGMLRFDPSKPDHTKFEIERKINSKVTEKSKKKKQKLAKEEEEKKEEEEQIHVSKDTFYKITDNLKESLQQKSTFSLLSMFGKAQEDENKEEEVEEETSVKLKKTKHIGSINNPFRYDSSDTEDEDIDKQFTLENNKQNGDYADKSHKERFFFSSDDLRLKEGLEFIFQTKNNINATDYSNIRREVKQIVRAKVRNNKRKNRPFKNKLGGRKRIRLTKRN